VSIEFKEAYLKCALGIKQDFPELNSLAATILIGRSYLHALTHQSIIKGYPLPTTGPAIVTSNHRASGDSFKMCIAGLESHRLIRAVCKKGLMVRGFSESPKYLCSIRDNTPSAQFNPLEAFVLKGEGAKPVNRERPGRNFLRDTDEVLNLNGILGIYLQPHRYKDCFLRNLQLGTAVIALRHPDIPIYVMVSSGHPYGRDKLTILKPFTCNQKVVEFRRKISAGELTIMMADMNAKNAHPVVQEDWRTRRPQELARLSHSTKPA